MAKKNLYEGISGENKSLDYANGDIYVNHFARNVAYNYVCGCLLYTIGKVRCEKYLREICDGMFYILKESINDFSKKHQEAKIDPTDNDNLFNFVFELDEVLESIYISQYKDINSQYKKLYQDGNVYERNYASIIEKQIEEVLKNFESSMLRQNELNAEERLIASLLYTEFIERLNENIKNTKLNLNVNEYRYIFGSLEECRAK